MWRKRCDSQLHCLSAQQQCGTWRCENQSYVCLLSAQSQCGTWRCENQLYVCLLCAQPRCGTWRGDNELYMCLLSAQPQCGEDGVAVSCTCACLHSHMAVWQSVVRVLVRTATWQCDSQLYVCLLPTQPQCGEDGVAVSCTCACPHSHMAV